MNSIATGVMMTEAQRLCACGRNRHKWTLMSLVFLLSSGTDDLFVFGCWNILTVEILLQ